MAPVKGTFGHGPPLAVLTPYHFTEAYSKARNARLQELAAGTPLGPPDLQAILGDPGIANPGTVNCVVFDPTDLALWVAKKRQPPVSQGEFVRFIF